MTRTFRIWQAWITFLIINGLILEEHFFKVAKRNEKSQRERLVLLPHFDLFGSNQESKCLSAVVTVTPKKC